MENTPSKASKKESKPDKHDENRAERLGALIVEQKPDHAPEHAPEHLGHLIVEAEQTTKKSKQEKTPKKITAERNIETMKRADLLDLSARIFIDGSSLLQIYETKLIGERGLRRLVSEYLRGGDVKKMLRLEIIEREIDFERDPRLRDRRRMLYSKFTENVGLKQLLDKVLEVDTDEEEKAAFYRARVAYDTWENSKSSNKRRKIDIAMISIITILAVLLIILLITR